MDSIASILTKFNPTEDKYVSREFQTFGIFLCEKLADPTRKGLYMRLAKTLPRPALEQALRFVVDSKANNKGALFMWKLKEMGIIGKKKGTLQTEKSE
ncbi:MAG: hypothetical protein WCJ70_00710 [bacterium]